jgi:hypothetical protein
MTKLSEKQSMKYSNKTNYNKLNNSTVKLVDPNISIWICKLLFFDVCGHFFKHDIIVTPPRRSSHALERIISDLLCQKPVRIQT